MSGLAVPTWVPRRHPALREQKRSGGNRRRDIQGLRAVAVLGVFANHLTGWPAGGYVGVDVFFVISGFIITSGLLRQADRVGTVSLKSFYTRRVKRIVPAATVVLVVVGVVSSFVYLSSRAATIRTDALYAFAFLANWRFADQGTNYFTQSGPVSPLRHYWSLSVEEQFYVVWPALVLIAVVVSAGLLRRPSAHRGVLAAVLLVAGGASFAWAVLQGVDSPVVAYYSSLTRAWELATGCLVAVSAPGLRRFLKDRAALGTVLSYVGLIAIGVAYVLVPDGDGFAAVWTVLPVAATALVMAAGLDNESDTNAVLSSRVGNYIGDISYSLYLWHWPVIVILAAVMEKSSSYYSAVVLLAAGMSMLSYHLVEDPLRRASWRVRLPDRSRPRSRRRRKSRAAATATVAAAAMLVSAAYVFVARPAEYTPPPSVTLADAPSVGGAASMGPEVTELQRELASAAGASSWPALTPTLSDAIAGPDAPEPVFRCGNLGPIDASCTFQVPGATESAVIVGDSVAMTYADPIRRILAAQRVSLTVAAAYGCPFVGYKVALKDDAQTSRCEQRKSEAVSLIRQTRPAFVVVSNLSGSFGSPSRWQQGLQDILGGVAQSVRRIIVLSAPPLSGDPASCYSPAASPVKCLRQVTGLWNTMSFVENSVAEKLGGERVSTRDLFCTRSGSYCPAFADGTPVRKDSAHMTPEYGRKITPALTEILSASRAFS